MQIWWRCVLVTLLYRCSSYNDCFGQIYFFFFFFRGKCLFFREYEIYIYTEIAWWNKLVCIINIRILFIHCISRRGILKQGIWIYLKWNIYLTGGYFLYEKYSVFFVWLQIYNKCYVRSWIMLGIIKDSLDIFIKLIEFYYYYIITWKKLIIIYI